MPRLADYEASVETARDGDGRPRPTADSRTQIILWVP
jgi:hypothetical protein